MPAKESVTFWIEQLKAGDKEAARPLWERYFGRLVHLARQRLRGMRRAVADEEDVALSAFDSFCRAAEQGRFPQLNDRDDLWRLLVVITERKSIDLARRQNRGKNDGPPGRRGNRPTGQRGDVRLGLGAHTRAHARICRFVGRRISTLAPSAGR